MLAAVRSLSAGMSSAKMAISRNKFFSIALLAGFVLRILTMIGYPGALWATGDTFRYLRDALNPQPDLVRVTGYSLFLRLLLPFHSFVLVALIQHMMGLAVAVMIYALARRAGVSRNWAAAATLPQLLDGFMIQDEHLIMPEAVFTFCLVLAMFLVLRKPAPASSWWVLLIAGLLVGYAAVERTEGIAAVVLFPAMVLARSLRTMGWRRLRGWLAVAAMAAGCLAPVAAYDAWFHQENGRWSPTGTGNGGFMLLERVSTFADCAKISAPATVLRYCPSAPPADQEYGLYIWNAPQVNKDMDSVGGPTSARGNKLLTELDRDAIKSEPLGYLKAIAGSVALSLEYPRPIVPAEKSVTLYKFHLQYSATAYQKSIWLPYGHQDPDVVVRPVARLLVWYEPLFYTWGPLLGLILILGLAGAIAGRRRREKSRWPLRMDWRRFSRGMFPWIMAMALYLEPMATTGFRYRYVLPVIPFACLAAVIALRSATPRQLPAASREESEPDDFEPSSARLPVSG